MPSVSTGTTSIPFGTNLRIGYRLQGNPGAFTYVSVYPTHNQLPYTFTVPTAGTWEIEYTIVCPTCTGNQFSDANITTVTF